VALMDETDSFVAPGLWDPSRDILTSKVLPYLQPGDAFCLIGIDATPYTMDDIRIPVTPLPEGTLRAAVARKGLIEKVRKLEPRPGKKGTGTPMTLVMANAAGILQEEGSRYRPYLVVFSDMAEDPPKRGKPIEGLTEPVVLPPDTQVFCFNVVPLGSKKEFESRVARWKTTFSLWGAGSEARIYTNANSLTGAADFAQELKGRSS